VWLSKKQGQRPRPLVRCVFSANGSCARWHGPSLAFQMPAPEFAEVCGVVLCGLPEFTQRSVFTLQGGIVALHAHEDVRFRAATLPPSPAPPRVDLDDIPLPSAGGAFCPRCGTDFTNLPGFARHLELCDGSRATTTMADVPAPDLPLVLPPAGAESCALLPALCCCLSRLTRVSRFLGHRWFHLVVVASRYPHGHVDWKVRTIAS
jgi:hypothetical protein